MVCTTNSEAEVVSFHRTPARGEILKGRVQSSNKKIGVWPRVYLGKVERCFSLSLYREVEA